MTTTSSVPLGFERLQLPSAPPAYDSVDESRSPPVYTIDTPSVLTHSAVEIEPSASVPSFIPIHVHPTTTVVRAPPAQCYDSGDYDARGWSGAMMCLFVIVALVFIVVPVTVIFIVFRDQINLSSSDSDIDWRHSS